MATPNQIQFLLLMKSEAETAQHKWPGAAAAEACEETGWGTSIIPNSNNVLGIKAYRGWTGPTVNADGTEQNSDGSWTGPQFDTWCAFQSPADCFREQMLILQEPRYALAWDATTVEDYIVQECRIWSTGLQKGQTVLAIYNAHKDVLA